MAGILRNWPLLAATCFSGLLVIGAYFFAQGSFSPNVAQASAETALLQQIATRDSTGDGLPDWEKQLYGIPLTATTTDYFHLGMTDGEAVAKGLIVPKAVEPTIAAPSEGSSTVDSTLPAAPAQGTLTDTFARNFFTLYINAKTQQGGDLSQDQLNQIAQQALSQLASSATLVPDFKTQNDLTVSGSSRGDLIGFAADAEHIFTINTSQATTSEIAYLKSAAQGDSSALLQIASISKSYRDAAVGLAKLPVPQSLAATDLSLINALMRLGEITNDFTQLNSDPVAAMVALQEYPKTVLDFGNAFIGIRSAYQTAGIAFKPGEPGARFVGLIDDIAASQKGRGSTTP